MANLLRCEFVRACLRENVLPMLRIECHRIDELDKLVKQAVAKIDFRRYQRISSPGVAAQLCELLREAELPAGYEFYHQPCKWRERNRFGFQRQPEIGMLPIVVYGTNQAAVAQLVREALRCFDVLYPLEKE